MPKQDSAIDLAVQSLSYIAQDMDRLGRFLALSGLGPAEIRANANDPAFLGGVLDFLMSDEEMVIDFAVWAQVDAMAVARARAALPGAAVD